MDGEVHLKRKGIDWSGSLYFQNIQGHKKEWIGLEKGQEQSYVTFPLLTWDTIYVPAPIPTVLDS